MIKKKPQLFNQNQLMMKLKKSLLSYKSHILKINLIYLKVKLSKNYQELLYAIEKPTINTKNTNSCRNSTGRLSAFDFLNQSTTNVNEKKTFLIVLKYFQNENKNVVMARKSTNLYGFSKASSKLR